MQCVICMKEVSESLLSFIGTNPDDPNDMEPVCPDCIESQIENELIEEAGLSNKEEYKGLTPEEATNKFFDRFGPVASFTDEWPCKKKT